MTSRRGRAPVAVLMIAMSLGVGSLARAQEEKAPRPDAGEAERVMRLTPAELTWTVGPPMLPPGARMAVIEGAFTSKIRATTAGVS
jgi:hypothetical protein